MERTWFPSELPVRSRASYAAGPAPDLPRYSDSYTVLVRLPGEIYPEEQSSAISHEGEPNAVGEAGHLHETEPLPGLPFGSSRAVIHTDEEVEAVEMTLLKVCRNV